MRFLALDRRSDRQGGYSGPPHRHQYLRGYCRSPQDLHSLQKWTPAIPVKGLSLPRSSAAASESQATCPATWRAGTGALLTCSWRSSRPSSCWRNFSSGMGTFEWKLPPFPSAITPAFTSWEPSGSGRFHLVMPAGAETALLPQPDAFERWRLRQS